MVAPFFDYNPRCLKQYINVLRLRIYIAYYSIGVTFAEKNTLNIEQISKFTALTLKYPRLLLELKNNNQLLAELEKYAVNRSLQSNHSIILTSESKPSDLATGNANYWLNNYLKIQQLLCSQIKSNNDQKNHSRIFAKKSRSIKKLLEVSPKGIPSKYFKLRQFLAAGEWKEADMETYRVMLQVAGRKKEGSLGETDIEKFPGEDLHIIDQLWVKYSLGKFGFSVQKKIYQNLGGTRKYNEAVYQQFRNTVGWHQKKGWLDYSELVFTLDTDYKGHLPVCGPRWLEKDMARIVREQVLRSLFSRRDL
ncbi:MAG: GUN4 domain-containing protein [Okeania sp. SIO3I5]|nr:GUN4 domain-containing protein [Okeania sp. SIO3I5]